MISKKRLVLISVLTILLVVGGLYATYAINVFEEEVTPTEYDMAFNFDLSGSITREMTVEAGKTKVFDIDITNPYSDTIQYGVAYSLVSPTTLPGEVTIAESNLSKNTAVGMIDANETLSISIVVVNESSSSVTLSFSVINGYKNGGDLIVPIGSTLVEGSYEVVPPAPLTSAEVLENLGLTSLLRTGTPDFSAAAITDEGIYAAEDDLGTSYYFRGASDHNYVLFDNKYWRIIRINGDGSVRIIYDGTSPHEDGESSTNRRVTTSVFNSNYSDNAFVGYMNGTTDGTNFPNGTTNSVSYTEAHTNTTDSTIKAYLEDTWYPTISEANRTHIVDAIYCNDREVSSANSSYTGDGSAKTKTWYKAAERLVTNAANATPILTCSQKDDRFTLESSNFEIETNGKLDAPVGLITADEMVLAGGTYNTGNSKYYLYSGYYYWTMSPLYFGGSFAGAFSVDSSGKLGHNFVNISDGGVRPVLSLSSSALTAGTGKIDDPFRISS